MNWALCIQVKKWFSKLAYIGIAWRVSSDKSAGLTSRVSDSGGLMGPRNLLPDKLPGNPDAAGWGPHFGNHSTRGQRSRSLPNVTQVAQSSFLAFLICLH